jgi:hydrogenase nickel incorporation protein HypA/HybF
MHELAITESILRIAVDEANKHGASKVLSIKIKVGEFSGVVPQLIQEYYNIVSRDTEAEGAELVIDRVPVTIRCLDCGKAFAIDRAKIKCPECGSINIKMVTGREFYVDSMEVE